MEDEIWKRKFKNERKKMPNQIAIEFCNKLYNKTNKTVIAKVSTFNVSFKDMTSSSPIFNAIKPTVLFDMSTVQDFLGAVDGNNKFTYEMYITGSKTKNYKYRFCFIEYGIEAYPLKIAMDSDIAKELEKSTIVECENEQDYKKLLIDILNSKKLTDVIEGLMAINLEN